MESAAPWKDILEVLRPELLPEKRGGQMDVKIRQTMSSL
jgi:hypothetical protein